MKICIVGGGHIGTTLLCYIKNHNGKNDQVSLFTRRPEMFCEYLRCNDWEKECHYEIKPDCISNDPSIAADNADIVFIALPHFAVEKAFCDIAPYVARDALIGVLPGGGGCEFLFHKYFNKDQALFGFQRVPFTAKLEVYGKETNLKSWKPYSVVGTTKRERLDEICWKIEKCGLIVRKAENYLSIALTPTNPILHTSRTYDLFHRFDKDHVFDEKCKYYIGWNDETSRIMLEMDKELHVLLDHIPEIDTSAIRPLSEHYESYTIEAMTKKINSIATFQSVYAPMKEKECGEGYIADLDSRMFTEDFPWGLAIFRAYSQIIGTRAPTMDKLLKWYSDYMGLEWYKNGDFCGKDLNKTGIPQIYGVQTKEDLLRVYR